MMSKTNSNLEPFVNDGSAFDIAEFTRLVDDFDQDISKEPSLIDYISKYLVKDYILFVENIVPWFTAESAGHVRNRDQRINAVFKALESEEDLFKDLLYRNGLLALLSRSDNSELIYRAWGYIFHKKIFEPKERRDPNEYYFQERRERHRVTRQLGISLPKDRGSQFVELKFHDHLLPISVLREAIDKVSQEYALNDIPMAVVSSILRNNFPREKSFNDDTHNINSIEPFTVGFIRSIIDIVVKLTEFGVDKVFIKHKSIQGKNKKRIESTAFVIRALCLETIQNLKSPADVQELRDDYLRLLPHCFKYMIFAQGNPFKRSYYAVRNQMKLTHYLNLHYGHSIFDAGLVQRAIDLARSTDYNDISQSLGILSCIDLDHPAIHANIDAVYEALTSISNKKDPDLSNLSRKIILELLKHNYLIREEATLHRVYLISKKDPKCDGPETKILIQLARLHPDFIIEWIGEVYNLGFLNHEKRGHIIWYLGERFKALENFLLFADHLHSTAEQQRFRFYDDNNSLNSLIGLIYNDDLAAYQKYRDSISSALSDQKYSNYNSGSRYVTLTYLSHYSFLQDQSLTSTFYQRQNIIDHVLKMADGGTLSDIEYEHIRKYVHSEFTYNEWIERIVINYPSKEKFYAGIVQFFVESFPEYYDLLKKVLLAHTRSAMTGVYRILCRVSRIIPSLDGVIDRLLQGPDQPTTIPPEEFLGHIIPNLILSHNKFPANYLGILSSPKQASVFQKFDVKQHIQIHQRLRPFVTDEYKESLDIAFVKYQVSNSTGSPNGLDFTAVLGFLLENSVVGQDIHEALLPLFNQIEDTEKKNSILEQFYEKREELSLSCFFDPSKTPGYCFKSKEQFQRSSVQIQHIIIQNILEILFLVSSGKEILEYSLVSRTFFNVTCKIFPRYDIDVLSPIVRANSRLSLLQNGVHHLDYSYLSSFHHEDVRSLFYRAHSISIDCPFFYQPKEALKNLRRLEIHTCDPNVYQLIKVSPQLEDIELTYLESMQEYVPFVNCLGILLAGAIQPQHRLTITLNLRHGQKDPEPLDQLLSTAAVANKFEFRYNTKIGSVLAYQKLKSFCDKSYKLRFGNTFVSEQITPPKLFYLDNPVVEILQEDNIHPGTYLSKLTKRVSFGSRELSVECANADFNLTSTVNEFVNSIPKVEKLTLITKNAGYSHYISIEEAVSNLLRSISDLNSSIKSVLVSNKSIQIDEPKLFDFDQVTSPDRQTLFIRNINRSKIKNTSQTQKKK